ncbi:MAG: hypothetical protein KIS94_08530 [Chitinophagales bacterium]|nr:hypothetical protein [Chitinophagales bacterium]
MPEAGKRILYCVLNWGLGHATRSIPVIEELLRNGAQVTLASDGLALKYLQERFPGLTIHILPAYNPVYPQGDAMVWKMGSQLPKFIKTIFKEQSEVEKIVANERIDVVISDNRYGCYSSKAKSVFITHQCYLIMPDSFKWMEPIVNRFNVRQLKRFSEIWIPAIQNTFTGKLCELSEEIPHRYIGFLSQLDEMKLPLKYKVCVLCSGPEPQRSIFEKMMGKQISDMGESAIMIRGTDAKRENDFGNAAVRDICHAGELNKIIAASEFVVARSGYSTIMDLVKLKKKAVFVPTPGQTEQEYLAGVLHEKRIAFCDSQFNFKLQDALKKSAAYTGFKNLAWNSVLLKQAVESVLC